jgi:putative membrane protein
VTDAGSPLGRSVPLLTGLTIAGQIAYPLVHGATRDRLTVAVVLLFAAASLAHAASSRGVRVAVGLLAVTAAPGFVAEVLGVRTGVPFGTYLYADTLGVRLWGVPLVIALAWTMFAWPAALVARRLVRTYPARVVLGAWALASWDLFLDPQMVAAGHWRWRFPDPHLPGVDAVPLTNYLGWLLVAGVVSAGVQAVVGVRETTAGRLDDRWPYALFVWTWLSSALALGAFLHLGAAAAWGFAAMGLVAVPFVRTLVIAR